MRRRFLDEARLLRQAQSRIDDGTVQIRTWWSDKYNRPPNHPLFLERTLGDLQLEMFEDWILEKTRILRKLEDEDTSMKERPPLVARLGDLNRMLGLPDESDDPLIDKWEAELLEGKVPDLDER